MFEEVRNVLRNTDANSISGSKSRSNRVMSVRDMSDETGFEALQSTSEDDNVFN